MERITIENIEEKHISVVTEMALYLWPDCNYNKEYENYKKIIPSENQEIFIARKNSRHIGFIQLSIRTDYVEGAISSPIAYIEGIYVEPIHRRKGVAHTLIENAEKWAHRKGCSEIASDTELINTNSIALHHSVGFREANRVVCFIKTIDQSL